MVMSAESALLHRVLRDIYHTYRSTHFRPDDLYPVRGPYWGQHRAAIHRLWHRGDLCRHEIDYTRFQLTAKAIERIDAEIRAEQQETARAARERFAARVAAKVAAREKRARAPGKPKRRQ